MGVVGLLVLVGTVSVWVPHVPLRCPVPISPHPAATGVVFTAPTFKAVGAAISLALPSAGWTASSSSSILRLCWLLLGSSYFVSDDGFYGRLHVCPSRHGGYRRLLVFIAFVLGRCCGLYSGEDVCTGSKDFWSPLASPNFLEPLRLLSYCFCEYL